MRTNHKQFIQALPLVILLTILLIIVACSNGSAVQSTQLTGTITEAGSTTVQPLAEKFAAAFSKLYPKVTVTIQGGGTGVGIKSANDGTVDIGAMSRELSAADPPLVKYLLAKDGIAMAVNANNKVVNLSKQQIVDIYTGKVKNWSQVGGDNKEIHVVAREEGSGTRAAFQELVMGKETIIPTAILQASNGAIRTTVAGDLQAIGFVSFGYIDKAIKALSINDVAATEANALNGTYPIVRPLYFVTKTPATGLVKEFIDFCISVQGQQIVAAEGYIPLK
jgi:phosphate transport system substrate-binding protein